MDIARRLERASRAVVRTARAPGRSAADAPRAAYARVLDGQHLWFALHSEAGSPVLLDPDSGDVVTSTPSPGATWRDSGGGFHSARWVVDEVLAQQDGATLVLAAENGGRIEGVRPPRPADGSDLPSPLTPDGRWLLALGESEDGVLTLRRERREHEALLVDVVAADNAVTLHLLVPDPDPDQAPAALVLIDRAGHVTTELAPLSAPDTAGVQTVTVAAGDVPADLTQHRVAVAARGGARPVTRHPHDVRISDASSVLMPHLVEDLGETILARFAWAKNGVLQLRPSGSRQAR